jgi:Ca-activated chloride channel family protein
MEASMRSLIVIVTLCLYCVPASAQERRLVRKGNELYQQQKYAEAAAAYQKALEKQPQYAPGVFNLGNALVQQKQYEAARKVLANAARTTKDLAVQSGAQYNTGNTYMSEQKWKEAIDAYKVALKKNPQDADAKYNLSYALAKLKKQQEQQDKNKDKKDQDNKDNKDQKDQKDQDKEDKNSKDQKPQDGDNNQQQNQRPQPQQSKISEQQADNLLKALQQDERKVQDKMQQGKGMPVKLEKDW